MTRKPARGLGRGLSALMADVAPEEPAAGGVDVASAARLVVNDDRREGVRLNVDLVQQLGFLPERVGAEHRVVPHLLLQIVV